MEVTITRSPGRINKGCPANVNIFHIRLFQCGSLSYSTETGFDPMNEKRDQTGSHLRHRTNR